MNMGCKHYYPQSIGYKINHIYISTFFIMKKAIFQVRELRQIKIFTLASFDWNLDLWGLSAEFFSAVTQGKYVSM